MNQLIGRKSIRTYLSGNDSVTTIDYPVREYPAKIISLNLDKDPVVSGRLTGIKGQYLLFGDHTGQEIRGISGQTDSS